MKCSGLVLNWAKTATFSPLRMADLAQHVSFQVLELGVFLRRHLVHGGQQGLDERQVFGELVLPARQVHVGQADLDLATHGIRARTPQVFEVGQVVVFRVQVGEGIGEIRHVGRAAVLLERLDAGQRARVVAAQRSSTGSLLQVLKAAWAWRKISSTDLPVRSFMLRFSESPS